MFRDTVPASGENMKKTALALVLALLFLIPLFSGEKAPSLFDINEELAKFESEELKEGEEEYYSSVEYFLVTGGPGSLIWENFGHTAILMVSPSSFPVAYDWGIFSFDDSFFVNFAFGKLYYEAWATYGEYRIRALEEDDRDIGILKLELTPREKKAMASFLEYSTRDENRTYLYDYFSDNCATRPRDIYSWATGGGLEEKLKGETSPYSIRETVERHLSLSSFPVAWTISFLLGPKVDGECTMWDACFLPSTLENEIAQFQGNSKTEYYSSKDRKPLPEKWNMKAYSFLMGVVLSLIPLLFLKKKRWAERTGDAILGVIYLYLGVLSLVLLFFMNFTIHRVTYGNINWMILSPLALLSSTLHFMSLGKKRREKAIAANTFLMLLLALSSAALKLIPAFSLQDSLSVFIPALMLYMSEIAVFLIRNRDNK